MKHNIIIVIATIILLPSISFANPNVLPHFRDAFQTSQSVCLVLWGYFSSNGQYRVDREMDGSSERIWDDKAFTDETLLLDGNDGRQVHVLSDTCLPPGIATYELSDLGSGTELLRDTREIEIVESVAECTDGEDICLQEIDPEDYEYLIDDDTDNVGGDDDEDDDGGCCG